MRDTRRQREALATFIVAGAAAVVGSYFFGPAVNRKLKVKGRK